MPGILRKGTVGIMPAGALGVSFFHHLTRDGTNTGRVVFLERPGSQSASGMRDHGELRIQLGNEVRTMSLQGIWLPDLLASSLDEWLPEVVLICTQPDQLLSVIQNAVELLISLTERHSIEVAIEELPCLVLSSNGIYFQRVRQFLVEKLEEATLFGRLPDLWPTAMPRIVGKLLRGVTIQTGQREGSGASALYRPGESGKTRIAGGSPEVRERCASLLTEMGGWFEVAGAATPTRVEFEKALVNLTVNLLGQIAAIDAQGRFRLLTVREILEGEMLVEARTLGEQVVATGRAVHAFAAEEPFEPLFSDMKASCEEHLDHIPSSLQWIDLQLRKGSLRAQLSPTEKWLLEPLIRYAHAAGLEDAAQYFESLARKVELRLALAVAHSKKDGTR